MLSERPSNESLNTTVVSFFPRSTPVDLAEMHCKIFNEKCIIEPTGIKIKTGKSNFTEFLQIGKIISLLDINLSRIIN